MTRLIGLSALLLLGGCLEAADLAEEQLAQPEYCASGNEVRLCAPGERPGEPAPVVVAK